MRRLRIFILGLSITSSWGNGHATTYRSLVRALSQRGHDVVFLEREAPWYRANRDGVDLPPGSVHLYNGIEELRARWRRTLAGADLVIIGSYVPEGIAVAALVQSMCFGIVAFYDIDTPVTLASLANGDCSYLNTELIAGFDLYLSFTGGPALQLLEQRYGARAARVLYCSVDPDRHKPAGAEPVWDLGYLGTYSADRQPAVEELMCRPARLSPQRLFTVAGPLYPGGVSWPDNVERIEHIGPDRHPWFYSRQRFTLNLTRADMIRMGYSPSVRLFEAAACGVPIISDWWPGLETIFVPGKHVLLARSSREVLSYLNEMPESDRRQIASRAREHVLARHTAAHRAIALEGYVEELLGDDKAARLAAAG
ncbi:MAG: glycosyltransferase [Alphaproteobacteria bacterium]|nr:glycosyltransferase [Alphaproteobacteria bacterium]MBV9375145.1 glycosyltransferase [Alphaproteobacteria bacterium]